MNERIKELHDKARQFYLQDEYLDLPLKQMHTLVEEKFADLIVRECLEQIDKIRDGLEADNEDQQALGADWAGLAVARHFGVDR